MLSYLNPLPQLPKYRGPFKVGSCEYEIPVSEIPSSSSIPDPSLTTIKFRVYYPTTPNAKSRISVPWLPTPQKEGNRAYAKFLGLSDRSSGIVANLPSMLSHPSLPVVHNAPLQREPDTDLLPVVVFSHGLGGNYNTYSSYVGSLASCGAVVFAPEHRDQSAPISFIRSQEDRRGRAVPYKKLSHQPSVEVLNARNVMLRTRLWELEKLYTVITAMSKGKKFTNFADSPLEGSQFQDSLDLRPSKVAWTGHSFGAATMVQFVKSVYYRQHAPPTKTNDPEGWDHTPLFTPAENSDLTRQITAKSPMTLLDLWAMPLTSKSTQWLWERPLPCYERQTATEEEAATNVISIMSAQFHKWPEMVNRTRALLSADPARTYAGLSKLTPSQDQESPEKADAEEPSPQLSLDPITRLETSKTAHLSRSPTIDSTTATVTDSLRPPSRASTRTPSPARSIGSSITNEGVKPDSPSTSISSLPSSISKSSHLQVKPELYLVPTSAHLSQSDFGVLFPNVTKYLLKTIEPEKIIELNVRATTAMMRNNGIKIATLNNGSNPEKEQEKGKDQILVPGQMDESLWTSIGIAA